MKINNYIHTIERCLFINVSDISMKLFNGKKFNKKYKAINYISRVETKSIGEYIDRLNIQNIIIETSGINHLPAKLTNEIISYKVKGIKVYEAHEFYELINRRVPLVKLATDDYLAEDIYSLGNNNGYFYFKRFVDLLVSIILLPIALPLIIFGGIGVWLSSKGSAFFVQERVGKNSKPFKIYKLRSMKNDHDGGYTLGNDDRVLPIGKLLRLTKIDELPQLFNILKGEMSLIGPRPERPEFVAISNEENAYFDLRHLITPGVTGWAQVNLPKATPDDNLKKLEYDLYYLKNCSMKLDLEILFKTIKVVLTMNSN